jgi:hypothetical protein
MRAELVAIAASVVLLTSGSARAFCRTTSVPVPPDFDASGGCFLQGTPLYHRSSCLPYRLLAKESPRIPNAVLSDKLARAFATWEAPNPVCTPGIGAIELAPVDDLVIANYTTGERGRNVVGVVSPWTHAGGQNSTLALSTLTFNADSGEVYDVDLEVNGDTAWSFTDKVPADGFDLQSAITHEVGHMLGFAHSPKPEATMFASYQPGTDTIRDLDRDDQDAVCWVYPTRTQRMSSTGLVPASACNLAPGAANAGCSDPAITHGCSIRRAPSGDVSVAFGAAALALLGLSRLRRRSSGSRADL